MTLAPIPTVLQHRYWVNPPPDAYEMELAPFILLFVSEFILALSAVGLIQLVRWAQNRRDERLGLVFLLCCVAGPLVSCLLYPLAIPAFLVVIYAGGVYNVVMVRNQMRRQLR